jgi:hypothetical protein
VLFSKILKGRVSRNESNERKHDMTGTEPGPKQSIFWDVENVADEAATHRAMTEKIRQSGTVAKAFAFADWDTRRRMAEDLYTLGYDLIHVPDSKENAADYKMASYILDHLIHYPETRRYVLITGDGDFRLIAGALKERGVELWLISNPIITATGLPELANVYNDIYSFRPSLDCVRPEDCDASVQSIVEQRHVASVQLQEVVREITKAGSKPGVGHAKIVMKSLNPSFDERDLGFSSWHEFLEWAEAQDYVKQEGELPYTVLSLPKDLSPQAVELTQGLMDAFDALSQAVEATLDKGYPSRLRELGLELKEKGVNFDEVGYRRFSDFLIAAEKRGLVRILPSEEDPDEAVVLPAYSPERMHAWFEDNVQRVFGSSVNIPKHAFLKKIAYMLTETRTTISQMEQFLLDRDVRLKYGGILKASEVAFLPPFQMSYTHVLLGKGFSCEEAVTKVNAELRPLGIVLRCPE